MSKAAADTISCKWFFHDLARARNRILVADYDGTIAPFSADRSRAFPYPTIPSLLDEIAKSCGTRLIMMTGRSAHRVTSLLGMNQQPEIWGTHGLERLNADGEYRGVEINDEAFIALASAEIALEDLERGGKLDVTPGSVAVHWRGLEPSEVLEIRTKAYGVFTPLAVKTGLVIAEFDGGVEMRLPDASAGDALRSLISETGPGVPIAYLGDDTPDEDAFRVLNGQGLTVLVRPKPRSTEAQLWLRPPDDLISFLKDWISACGGKL